MKDMGVCVHRTNESTLLDVTLVQAFGETLASVGCSISPKLRALMCSQGWRFTEKHPQQITDNNG